MNDEANGTLIGCDPGDPNVSGDPARALEGVEISFGLVAQGHIPTIERCLADGWTWLEIGEAIGWCGRTAEQHYKWYLEANERANQSER